VEVTGASAVPVLPDVARLRSRARDENFPVAMRVLRPRTRRHLMAIYDFARLCDQCGDGLLPDDRAAALDWLETAIPEAFLGIAEHPTLRRVGATARECALPAQPFHDLVAANRRDQVVHDYESFDELVDYCRVSANPIGCLVLGVFGVSTPERVSLSDRVCTALQLVEHWQDVGEDARVGRVYLPGQDRRCFGVDRADLASANASPALRALLRFEAARTRQWLDAGPQLVTGLRGEARLAVAGYVAGGRATLDAMTAVDFDVLGNDVRPRRARVLVHLVGLLVGRQAVGGAR
jgi:squalene synthase HpnC